MLGATGPLGLVLVAVVSLSFVQSWFLLELKPLWARGILRYGYKDPTFAEVLPVISASVRGCLPVLEGPSHACYNDTHHDHADACSLARRNPLC